MLLKSFTMWYFYVVKCSDGTLYSGITNDLEKRIKTHNLGKGAKYTRSRLPVKLLYSERKRDRITASRREYQVKRLTRAEKKEMISKARKNEKKRY